ncbi:hypothetical protein [Siminovitchia fortis]|uniref:Uncharacterized protein n=1 Tax=Siminovitchia fortis TaxID=254758 RepID=A0A443IJA6_9BACI|nr:hypothetical protein [Siminovitchia fortis]RWR04535.1 hypothetical protein D4N35_016835 [Siminovitchia fortis]WHY80585.1 hypothetical protein QNH23_11620 [Siminovitchia fortis]
MNHIEYEKWMLYATDSLDEKTRMHFENHLYSCDHCLELYLQAVEEAESQMPVLSDPSGFTDSIMKGIGSTQEKQPPAKMKPKKNIRKQTLVHYTAAAAMTLVLMSTGIFSQLTTTVSSFENAAYKQDHSVISGWLNKTDSITEKIEDNLREGNKHE